MARGEDGRRRKEMEGRWLDGRSEMMARWERLGQRKRVRYDQRDAIVSGFTEFRLQIFWTFSKV